MSTCQGTEILLVLTSVSNTGLVDILTVCSAFFLVFLPNTTIRRTSGQYRTRGDLNHFRALRVIHVYRILRK